MKGSFDRYLERQLKKRGVRQAFDEERFMLSIGLALANERKKKGMSQQEVAKKIGTSAPQISRTERKPEHANVRTLQRYAAAVGMKLDVRLRAKR